MKLKRAPLWRRFAAAVVDLVAPISIATLVGFSIADQPYVPEPGWFWSEWLLKIWLDHPSQLVIPIVTAAVGFLVWQAAWESRLARTPGGVLLGLEVVDSSGDPIEWPRALIRFVGGILSVVTLGFGWCWAWVDPEGRGLPDRLAGTWVVLHEQ